MHNVAMKNRTAVTFLIAGSLLLAGCSMAGIETDFYKVNYYTDYEGIDSDASSKTLNPEAATPIGFSYAKKEKTVASDSTETVTYFGVGDPTNLVEGAPSSYRTSTRDAVPGYDYVFAGWMGFYDDGSEIDINEIHADCNVFAKFDLVPKDYSVTISGLSDQSTFYTVQYGNKLIDLPDFEPIEADPLTYYDDPYYETRTLQGLQYTVDGVDRSSEVTAPYKDFIANTPIVGKTEFKYVYNEPVKKMYTVTYRCISDDDPAVLIQDWEDVQVEYAEEFTLPDIDATHWSYLRCVGTYQGEAVEADVPELSGMPVDIHSIRHSCTIDIYYRIVAEVRYIQLCDENGDPNGEPMTVYKGQIPYVSTPSAPTGKTFTGVWVHKSTLEPFDMTQPIEENLELVPIFVDTNVTKEVTLLDTVTMDSKVCTLGYIYSLADGGYLLKSFTAADTNDLYDLTAADIANTYVGGYNNDSYYVVGIQGFGTSANAQTIHSAVLPANVKRLVGTCFRGMANVSSFDFTNVGLTEIGDLAFDQLSSLEEVILPSTLETVGHRIVNGCKYLPDGALKIHMSEAQVEQKITDGDFAGDWNYSSITEQVQVTYLG